MENVVLLSCVRNRFYFDVVIFDLRFNSLEQRQKNHVNCSKKKQMVSGCDRLFHCFSECTVPSLSHIHWPGLWSTVFDEYIYKEKQRLGLKTKRSLLWVTHTVFFLLWVCGWCLFSFIIEQRNKDCVELWWMNANFDFKRFKIANGKLTDDGWHWHQPTHRTFGLKNQKQSNW